MKRLGIFCLLILICSLTAGICLGQETTLMFEKGEVLVGEVMKTTENSITFKYRSGGEDVVGTFEARDLDPHSFYMARKLTIGNSAAAHLSLAKFALEHNMYLRAIFHYQTAKELDPSMIENFDREEKPFLKEKAAAKLLASAKKAIDKGKLLNAESDLSSILTYFHDTKVAEEARALVVKVGNERVKEAMAEQPKEGGTFTLVLNDGRNLKGTVLGSSKDSVRFQFYSKGAKVTTTLPVSRIDPVSFFDIRKFSLGNDPGGHLDLAKFCVEKSLFVRAYFLYERAKTLDPAYVEVFEKKELPQLKEELAAKLFEGAKKAVEKKEYKSGAHDLSAILIRFPETRTADRARSYLDELEQEMMRREAAKTAKAMEKMSAEEKREYEKKLKLLEPAKRNIDQGNRMNNGALKDSTTSKARREFEAAAARFERALDDLDKVEKSGSDDRELMEMAGELRKQAKEGAIEAYINAGSIQITRGSYNDAHKLANKALAIDPQSSRAQGFRARVESAAAMSSSDWGARWRGRRR